MEAVEKAGGKLTVTAPVKEKSAAPKKKKAAPPEEPLAEAEDDAGTDKE